MTLTLYTMSSVTLLLLLTRLQQRRGSLLLIYCLMPLLCFAHLVNGKRQGLYAFALFLVVGLSLSSTSITVLAGAFGLPRRKLITVVGLLAIAGAAPGLFDVMGSLRTQNAGDVTRSQSLDYLEYSLLNIETQCAAAGLGPYEFRPLGPFRQLIPFKSVDSLNLFSIEDLPKAEITSPAGMFELIQWCYGPLGIALYSFLLGWLARTAFQRAPGSVGWLLTYCYLAVSLSLAQTNNQLLILTYFPAPLIISLAMSKLIGTVRLRRTGGRSRYETALTLPRRFVPRTLNRGGVPCLIHSSSNLQRPENSPDVFAARRSVNADPR